MKRKNIKESIKEYFFLNPTIKLRVREIERTLKTPLPSVIRYCKELIDEGILTTEINGRVTFYTANRAGSSYILGKKLYNLKQIYMSGLIDHLKIELSNPVIIIFGSFAKGEDIEKSDIDIYIETKAKKEVCLDKYESILKRKIQVLRSADIKNIKNKHLANNIINGITLNNYLEVFR